jgi:hypothetical protein
MHSSGEIINSKIAQIREQEYSKNEGIGSYMYYFKHRGKNSSILQRSVRKIF